MANTSKEPEAGTFTMATTQVEALLAISASIDALTAELAIIRSIKEGN